MKIRGFEDGDFKHQYVDRESMRKSTMQGVMVQFTYTKTPGEPPLDSTLFVVKQYSLIGWNHHGFMTSCPDEVRNEWISIAEIRGRIANIAWGFSKALDLALREWQPVLVRQGDSAPSLSPVVLLVACSKCVSMLGIMISYAPHRFE